MDCPIQQLLLLFYGLGSWNWWSRSTHSIDVFYWPLLIMNLNDVTRFCYMWHVNINYLVYSCSLYFSVCRGLDNSFLVDFTWVEQTVDSVTTVVTSVTAECWNVDSVPTLSCLLTVTILLKAAALMSGELREDVWKGGGRQVTLTHLGSLGNNLKYKLGFKWDTIMLILNKLDVHKNTMCFVDEIWAKKLIRL